MPSNPVMVLLVGETARSSSNVLEWLERRGSRCQFSRSYGDACELIRSTQFDLVLSEYQLPDRTAFPLLDWLEGSSATLFFSTRVEDGSLWLKMLERGTLGTLLAAAVEPSEQARVDSNTATLRPSLNRFWP
jgi:CheY-like chemotaxis protein